MLILNLEGYTLASLYCDAKTTEAFTQLFSEFFDTVQHVAGEVFKHAPFYPYAKCLIVMLDGEVPQALGLGALLSSTTTLKSVKSGPATQSGFLGIA